MRSRRGERRDDGAGGSGTLKGMKGRSTSVVGSACVKRKELGALLLSAVTY